MKKALLVVALGMVAACGAAWWWMNRTEPIPETLDALEANPSDIEIPGLPGQAPLRLADLRGKTAVFVVTGTWSAKSPEGEATNRALSRWVLPPDTIGLVVADAGGLGVFSDDIESTMGSYAKEILFPLYVDFEGVFVDTFKLPKGHHGLVVLGPRGEVIARHSGGLEGRALESLRVQIGAREPAPGPAMPSLKLGALDTPACAETVCAFVFAGPERVDRADIPGIRPGGFEGDEDERLAQMLKPAVRAVTMARKMKLSEPRGALVGDVDPEISSSGWDRVGWDAASEARAALGVGDDEVALVVFDHGREAIRVRGLVRLFEWGMLADLLGVEGFNDRRPPRG